MFKSNLIFVIVFISVTVVLIRGSDVTPKNKIEENFLTLLMRWRGGYRLPLSLPHLNLVTINGLEGIYNAKGIQFTYSCSELQFRGLSNFSVVELDVSENKLAASGKLTIPMVTITADSYKIHGRAFYIYTLTGSGRLKVKMRNIKLLAAIRLGGNSWSTNTASLDLDFAVGSIEADLENSSWPINKMLNSEGVSILNGYHDTIINATKTVMRRRFDDLLATTTPKQLLGKLSNMKY